MRLPSMACPRTPLETRSRHPAPRPMPWLSLMDGAVEAGLPAQRRHAHIQCMSSKIIWKGVWGMLCSEVVHVPGQVQHRPDRLTGCAGRGHNVESRAAGVTTASQGVCHECAGAEASPRSAHPDAGNLPDLSLIPGGSPSAEDAEAEQPMSWRSEAGIEGPQLAPSAEQTGNGDGTPAVPNQQQMTLEDPLPEQFTTLKVPLPASRKTARWTAIALPVRLAWSSALIIEALAWVQVSAERMDSLSRSGRLRRAGQQEPTWLLINDFSISPTSKSEVLQLFGGHKLPCLLYYTQASTPRNISHVLLRIMPRTSIRYPFCGGPAGAQHWARSWTGHVAGLPRSPLAAQVSVMQQETRQDFQAVPVPVLTHEAFHQLCRAPPLQVSLLGLSRLAGPSFWPLAPEEGPQEGLLLGLDAEFVAFSPPTKAFRGCAPLPAIADSPMCRSTWKRSSQHWHRSMVNSAVCLSCRGWR